MASSTIVAELRAIEGGVEEAIFAMQTWGHLTGEKSKCYVLSDHATAVEAVNKTTRVRNRGAMLALGVVRAHLQDQGGNLQIVWVPGASQLADALTKKTNPEQLVRVLYDGTV